MAVHDMDFLTSLVAEGKRGLERVRDSGITMDYIESNEIRKIYQWILDFNAEYGETPSRAVVEKYHGKDHFSEPEQGLAFTLDQLRQRRGYVLTANLANSIAEVYHSKQADDLWSGVDKSTELVKDAARRLILEVSKSNTRDINKTTQERLQTYYERQNSDGITGIPTAWPPLTKKTRGWQRGQLYMFLAKEGTGKTFNLLLQQQAAEKAGYKTLYFTEEMSEQELAFRSDAIGARIPYGDLIRGQLSPEDFETWVKYLKEKEKSPTNSYINEGAGPDGLQFIIELCEQLQPDIIFIDNIYLYARDLDYKSLADLSKTLKKAASRLRIPIVFTSQLNEKGDAMYSKAFGHDVSYRINMIMPPGQEHSRWFESTKQRDSDPIRFGIHFNPNTGNFEVDDKFTFGDDDQASGLI